MLDHWLTSSWAISCSCFEFMSTAVLPTPDDAALLGPSPASSSCSLSAPSWVVPVPRREGQVTPVSHLWWSTPLMCSALWSALSFYSALSFSHTKQHLADGETKSRSPRSLSRSMREMELESRKDDTSSLVPRWLHFSPGEEVRGAHRVGY